MRLHGQPAHCPLGIPTADNDFVLTFKQRCDGMAPDEACAAEH
jgi:hypothetical protein